MTIQIADLLRSDGPVLVTREHSRHRRMLARAAGTGRLVAVLPGTYVDADTGPLTWQHRALAVTRWRPDAVICGSAAAHLTFWPELAVTELRVAVRTDIRRAGFRFERRTVPPELVLRTGSGVRLTAPELTVLDLIDEHGGEAIDRALRSRQVTLDRLWGAMRATSDRSGNTERRLLLLDSRDKPWSEAERLAHQRLRAAGIGGWCTNHPVIVAGGRRFIDIAFRTLRLAVEIDGRPFHDNPEAFETDRSRHNDLVVAGWTVLRFTWRMLVDDPETVIATIREMMRRCARAQRSA